uniref:DM2 domain-containing protein n=1 Tax=viral metagenome TaxID=1070528 RepID=A0A6C0DIE3_9ZZZZ
MARQTKTKAETEQVQTASATTTVPVVAPKEKKVKVSKTPKVVATSTSEVAPVVDPVEVAPAVVVDSEVEAPIAEQSVEFIAKLQQASVLLSSLKNEFRTLEKKWSRELKIAQKQSSKRKRKAGNRAPSGFVKPTRISDELAKFLDKPVGTEMARTEVTRDINKYIRAHSLQDNENGRKINPDTKLAALLKLTKTDELTYFNLQKYMSCHFAKATKEVGANA